MRSHWKLKCSSSSSICRWIRRRKQFATLMKNKIWDENSDRAAAGHPGAECKRRKLFWKHFNDENGAFPLSWCRCYWVRWCGEYNERITVKIFICSCFAAVPCWQRSNAIETFTTFVINFSRRAKCSFTLPAYGDQWRTISFPTPLFQFDNRIQTAFRSICFCCVASGSHPFNIITFDVQRSPSTAKTCSRNGQSIVLAHDVCVFLLHRFHETNVENGAKMPILPSRANTNVLIHSIFNSTQRVFQLVFLATLSQRLSFVFVCVCCVCCMLTMPRHYAASAASEENWKQHCL